VNKIVKKSRSFLHQAWKSEIQSLRQQIANGTAKAVAGEEVTRKAWKLAKPK
jgi:hypothetical protein